MRGIQINCDVGEGVGNEVELMPFIHHCNIACGGHAGDAISMNEMVELAQKHKVGIGAHPSYPDPVNFGRKPFDIKSKDLIHSISKQIESLLKITRCQKAIVTHIKAHGALYNDIAKNEVLARAYLNAVRRYKINVKLVVPYNSIIAKLAIEQGFTAVYEAFADRNYNDDLSLVSRGKENAILTDISAILKHVKSMKVSGSVVTVNNRKIKITADTFCVHSDTSNAIEIVKALNKLAIS
jgi:UPF0271 protein